MSNFNNKYNVGSASLAEPFFDYCHTLPLVAFGDVKSGVELSLVFNSNIKDENHFNIGSGFKLNLQKKLLINGSTVKLLDSNGIKVDCNHATNQTAQYATVYALNDNSHRILRKNTDCCELEYADFSKEIFDTTGKITNLFDKYGEEMMRYVYNANGLLESVLYRPGVSEIYKVLNLVYDTYSCLSAIQYCANDTVQTICNIERINNELIVKHYAGSDLHYNIETISMTVYSTDRDREDIEGYCHQIKCNKGADNNIYFEYFNGINKIGQESCRASLDANNEIRELVTTDINGVMTKVEYKDHIPCYSYETATVESTMFASDGNYIGTINIQENDGICGSIAPNEGFVIPGNYVTYQGLTYDFSGLSTEHYIGNAVFCGWIKCNDVRTIGFAINGGKIQDVKVETPNKWQFFALPFYSNQSNWYVSCDNQYIPETRGTKIVLLSNHLTAVSKGMKNSSSNSKFKFKDVSFVNRQLNQPDSIEYHCSETDILRYLVNTHSGKRTNEFYYNNGRDLITNVGEIHVCKNANSGTNQTLTYIGEFNWFFNEYFQKNFAKEEIKYFGVQEEFFVVKHPMENVDRELVDAYNIHLDRISSRNMSTENNTRTTIEKETLSRNSKGLIITQTLDNDITRQYSYDENCTKLLSETDEYGTTITYETDDIWGVVTKATVENLAETRSTYTDDGADLTSCSFGLGANVAQNAITYSYGDVFRLQSGNLNYTFDQGAGILYGIKKNSVSLKTIAYADDYKTTTVTSPTSSTASYVQKVTKDKYGRTTGVYNSTTAITPNVIKYEYESYKCRDEHDDEISYDCGSGQLKKWTDVTTGQTTSTGYNNAEGTGTETVSYAGTKLNAQTYVCDEIGRPETVEFQYNHNGTNYTNSIQSTIEYMTDKTEWDADSRVDTYDYIVDNTHSSHTCNEYDSHKRISLKTINVGNIDFKKEIVYDKMRIASTTDTIESSDSENSVIGETSYEYDALGRIVSESDSLGQKSKTYAYDSLGRLIREDNQELGKTYAYTYDATGNITSKKTYAYTTGSLPSSASATETFVYNSSHPDRLTAYAGKSITYDQQGCPISYDGKTFTWTRGKLTKISKGTSISFDPNKPTIKALDLNLGAENWTFEYNGNGQRTQQKYNYTPPTTSQVAVGTLTNQTTNYTYDHSGRLVAEISSLSFRNGSSQSHEIKYLYDCNTIVGMVHNGTAYYFMRNIQGDVVGVYNSTGTKVVTFKYDAFGKCTVGGDTVLAQWCRIRYRGYYYDTQTGLYWVQTRYYNPDWCRWISPDNAGYLDPETPHGLNLYLYCGNDPVNLYDPTGHIAITTILLIVGAIIGASVGGAVAYDIAEESGAEGWELAGWTILGVIGGGALGGALGYGIGTIPAVGAFAGTSFSIGGGLSISAGGAAAATAGVTITGTQVLAGAGVLAGAASLAGIMMFAKGNGPRMGHNQYEKKQWNEAMRRLGITDKDLMRRLHNNLHKYEYQRTLDGLIRVLKEILTRFGM